MKRTIFGILDTPLGQWTGWDLITAWIAWVVIRLIVAFFWGGITAALGIDWSNE